MRERKGREMSRERGTEGGTEESEGGRETVALKELVHLNLL